MAPVWRGAHLGDFDSVQRSIGAVDRLHHLLPACLHHRDGGLHVQALDLRKRRDVAVRHGEFEAIALIVDPDQGDPLASGRILRDRREEAAVRREARIAEVPRRIVIDDLRHMVRAIAVIRHHLAGHPVEDELVLEELDSRTCRLRQPIRRFRQNLGRRDRRRSFDHGHDKKHDHERRHRDRGAAPGSAAPAAAEARQSRAAGSRRAARRTRRPVRLVAAAWRHRCWNVQRQQGGVDHRPPLLEPRRASRAGCRMRTNIIGGLVIHEGLNLGIIETLHDDLL